MTVLYILALNHLSKTQFSLVMASSGENVILVVMLHLFHVGLDYFDHAYISWSILYFLISLLYSFNNVSHYFMLFLTSPFLIFPLSNFFAHFYLTFPLYPCLSLFLFHKMPHSHLFLCLFYTIPNISKYIGSSLHSPSNPLEEAVNVIFLINNFNFSSHKYIRDDFLCIFIKARALFGVLVLNKHSSQQCSSPI